MPVPSTPVPAAARSRLPFFLSAAGGLALLAASATAGLRPPGDAALRRLEAGALRMINEARRTAGLGPLAVDPALGAAARESADEMVARDFVGHVSPRPDRRTGGMRLAAAGISDAEHGENVGRFGTSREGATWSDLLAELSGRLLASPDHRPQILGASYTHAGTGIAVGLSSADADSTVRVPTITLTQLFVARRVELRELSARTDGAGLIVALAGAVVGRGRPALRILRHDAPPELHDLSTGHREFSTQILAPMAGGRTRLELDVVDGPVTRPARRWIIDPLQPPDQAVTSALVDE